MGSEIIRKKVFKFGHGNDLQIVDLPTDLWEGSAGLYPFQTAPVQLYISSSSIADVGIPIMVEGLDANGIIQRQTAILNGQTQVALPGLWYRQYRAMNNDSGTLCQGVVYVAESDTLTGGIPNTTSKIKIMLEVEFQQTQMLIYTTPRDQESNLCHLFMSIIPKTTATVYARIGLYMRRPGKSWTNQAYFGLITSGTSAFMLDCLEVSGTIPPLTDIVVRAVNISANGIELAGYFTLKFIRKVVV